MRPARKEHALLAPLLGAAPVKGVIYFGAELMVRIHLPPAVNRTNFRIAPLTGPLPLGASPGCEERDLKILIGARSDATPKRTQWRRSRSPRNDQRPAQHALATTRQARRQHCTRRDTD